MRNDEWDTYNRPRRTAGGSGLMAVLLAAMAGAGLFWAGNRLLRERGSIPGLDPTVTERVSTPRSEFDGEERQAISVFQAARDSVVNVDTMALVRNRQDLTKVQEQQTGTGSGFFWDDQGRIVTNFHVVKEAIASNLRLRVVLADRTAWSAQVVGYAPDYDLAVVQISDGSFPKDKIKPIKVGTSKDIEVGQKAFAIGNPFGLSLTMTAGIVSALDRQIESPGDRAITGAIQHSAQINPGNSGGPLLDKDARLIGVNTAITSPSGGNVGIGFSIPIDTVNPVVTELIQRGRILQPDLGLSLVDSWRLRRAGYTHGVMVKQVDPQGPAATAGMRGIRTDSRSGDVEAGDLITAVNGEAIADQQQFARKLATAKVGETWKLTVERNGKTLEIEVVIRGV